MSMPCFSLSSCVALYQSTRHASLLLLLLSQPVSSEAAGTSLLLLLLLLLLLFFARLLGVVEAEDVALAEYDAVAAAQAYALLHTLAVHVAQSAAHRSQLDKLVGLGAQAAMLAEYVRAHKHNVLRFERIRSAHSVDFKLND